MLTWNLVRSYNILHFSTTMISIILGLSRGSWLISDVNVGCDQQWKTIHPVLTHLFAWVLSKHIQYSKIVFSLGLLLEVRVY